MNARAFEDEFSRIFIKKTEEERAYLIIKLFDEVVDAKRERKRGGFQTTFASVLRMVAFFGKSGG